MIQYLKDILLELRILWATNKLLVAASRDDRLFLARKMERLIKRRSPGQVRKMEKRMGLL